MKKQTASVISAFVLLFLSYNSSYSQNAWQVLNSGVNYNLTSISVVDSTHIFIFGNNILKTTNAGLSWIEMNKDTNYYNYIDISFVSHDKGIAIVTRRMDGKKGLLRTFDGGNNWAFSELNMYNSYYNLQSAQGEVIYISLSIPGSIPFPNTFYLSRSTDFGNSWNYIHSRLGEGFYFYFKNPMIGFIIHRNNILATTNGGSGWLSSSIQLPNYGSFYPVTLNSNIYYIASFSSSKLFKTINSGSSWDSISSNIFSDIGFFTSNDTGYCYSTHRIYKTTNGGLNWASNNYLGVDGIINKIEFLNSKTGYAVGNNGLILKTTTGGETVGIHPIANEVPNKFLLSQNYPNPFNPQTKFRFEIPKSDFVKIIVYDNLGKEIKTIINEQLSAGTYEADFNGGGLSSGVYYYKLITSSFSKTKKMLLVK